MEIVLETLGSFRSIEEIGDVLIPVPGTQAAIPLRDIASIRKAYVEPIQNPAYYNGHQAIVLSVFLFKGVDAVAFGERLKKKVKEIEQSLALGYKLDFATFQPELITKAVNGMVSNVVQSVVIVLGVVMIMLGFRTGLIVGSFIPLVMLFGVVMMSVLNIDMQRISLATMIIALGMFVDNAIVVSDDMYAHNGFCLWTDYPSNREHRGLYQIFRSGYDYSTHGLMVPVHVLLHQLLLLVYEDPAGSRQ